MAGNIACDLTITTSMVWFLWKARGTATFKPTKTMVAKILTFTLETGLITTLWMVIQLILQASLMQSVDHFASYLVFFYPSGMLYAIWLLATLNARASFNAGLSSLVEITNLPTTPGELRFRHPTMEGNEVVISINIANDGVASRGGDLEAESDAESALELRGTGKQSDDTSSQFAY
ncbi:hypothetical protein EYR38_008305 [Pleurotus pulmonarius]|nr:hypothetical protein EYR38_008305 [Pleurotus pulmonarius]